MVVTEHHVRFGRRALAALAAGLIVLPVMSIASDTLRPASVEIEATRTENSVTILGTAFGTEAVALEAELKVERTGAAGNTVLEQHKSINITPDARIVFGQVSVSFAAGDSLVARAMLRSGDTIIAETETVIGAGKNRTSGGN